MAPYNWLILFSMFNMIMIFFNSSNYYILLFYPFQNKSFNLEIYSMYMWKW